MSWILLFLLVALVVGWRIQIVRERKRTVARFDGLKRVPCSAVQMYDATGQPVGPTYRQNPVTFEWEVVAEKAAEDA